MAAPIIPRLDRGRLYFQIDVSCPPLGGTSHCSAFVAKRGDA